MKAPHISEVRAELEKLEVPKMVVWIDKEMKIETTQLTDKTVDEILAVFQNHTQSVLDELEARLPIERGIAGEQEYGWARSEAEPFNDCLNLVREAIQAVRGQK